MIYNTPNMLLSIPFDLILAHVPYDYYSLACLPKALWFWEYVYCVNF